MSEFLPVGLIVATAIPLLWLFGRPSDRTKSTAKSTDPSGNVIVVPRTLSPAYYFFVQTFAKANALNLMVDRRANERRLRPGRVVAERRSDDRRGARPTTWQQGDFIVVRAPGTAGDRAAS